MAKSAGVFDIETISDVEVVKGRGTGKLHCMNGMMKLSLNYKDRELIPRKPIVLLFTNRNKTSQLALHFHFLTHGLRKQVTSK